MEQLSQYQAKTLYKQAMKTVTARAARWTSSEYDNATGRLKIEATVPRGLAKALYDHLQLTGMGNNQYNPVSVRVNTLPTVWCEEHQSFTDSHIVTLLVAFPSIEMHFYNTAGMTPQELGCLFGNPEGVVTSDFNAWEDLSGEVCF